MKKLLYTIWIISLLLFMWWIFYNFHDVMFKPTWQFTWDSINLTWYVIATWNNTTWNNTDIETWTTIITGSTNQENYIDCESNWNCLPFYPQHQPYKNSEWYTSDSEILNQYLAKNTFYIDISRYPELKNWWYLYIRTKEYPTDWIFMYRHNAYWECWNPVSWKLVQSDKYKISDTEFIYPIDAIELIAFYSKKKCIFNRKNQINNRKNQYIWWYVASTKGNTIEEIIVAWEK